MTTELRKTEEALGVAVDRLKECERAFELCCLTGHAKLAHDALDKITAILHPEPQYEEVAVERWAVFEDDDLIFYASETAAKLNNPGCDVFAMKGTCRRAIPQPVERSVLVFKGTVQKTTPYTGSTLAECIGKTGTLTFTWTDPQ